MVGMKQLMKQVVINIITMMMGQHVGINHNHLTPEHHDLNKKVIFGSSDALPLGWYEAEDPETGDIYYYTDDGRTTWDFPDDLLF